MEILFMKELICVVALLVLSISVLVACTPTEPIPDPTATSTITPSAFLPTSTPTPTPTPEPDGVTLTAPEDGGEVVIQTAQMLRFWEIQKSITSETTACPFPWPSLNVPYPSENSRPKAVMLEWKTVSALKNLEYKIYVDTDETFPAPAVYTETAPVYGLVNLYIAQTYYWKVEAYYNNTLMYTSETRSFRTADIAPRVVSIPSVGNARDMGGWHTKDGRVIRQGCMYRSTEFDDHYAITDNGRKVIVEELGIKVDFDIRGMETAVFDESLVRHEVFALGSYGGIVGSLPKATVRRIYDLMYNSPEEPFIVHCWGGADRTGSLVFILNGLLGVEYSDLCADFEFTGFSVHGERCQFGKEFAELIKSLRRYGNAEDDVNTCIEKFFLKRGITAEEITALRDKLLIAPN